MKRSTNRQMTKIPRRAFPRHLAKLARERWDQLVAGDYSPPPCPPEKLLRELFEVVYLTASAPEEDRYPKFNLVAAPATDGGDQQEIGRRSQFVERRPLSVAELRRLAPAVDMNKSAIWVVWDDKAWKIAGLVDLGTSWFRARLGLGYQYRYPQCLLVQIDRPGRLRIYQGTYHVATLTDGVIEGHEGTGFHLSLHEPTNSGLTKMRERIIHPKMEEPREYFEFEFMALWNTYAAIVNTISIGRHGGALIIGDDDASASSPHLRIKYRQKSPALQDAFIGFINARNHRADILASRETEDAPLDEQLSAADLMTRYAYDELVEASRFVAQLSGCDGAIMISDDLNLLGFGVEIAAELRESSAVGAADTDQAEVNRKFRKLDVEQFGMRHRSALKLVSQEPSWRVLVVSQDGPISAVWSEHATVIIRRGVNLVNINMPWA